MAKLFYVYASEKEKFGEKYAVCSILSRFGVKRAEAYCHTVKAEYDEIMFGLIL